MYMEISNFTKFSKGVYSSLVLILELAGHLIEHDATFNYI